MKDEQKSLFTFRVEGAEEPQTALRRDVHPFDETYEIEGEHPAEALEKLVRGEIEWGILDGYSQFCITFIPKESDE